MISKFIIFLSAFNFLPDTPLCICWFPHEKDKIIELINEADLIVYATARPSEPVQVDGEAYRIAGLDTIGNLSNVEFEIHEHWKGTSESTMRFELFRRSCNDNDFELGLKHIIFAMKNPDTGKFETGNCYALPEFPPGRFDKEYYDRFRLEREFIKEQAKKLGR